MSSWPKQSPEHIAKRAKAVEGEKNGRYKTGRRSYREKLRRKGKLKVGKNLVHHKNGNQDDNAESNLEVISHKKHEEIHKRAKKDSLVYCESYDYWVS